MCGLIGFFNTGSNKKKVNELVLNQFENQKDRGINGFGIIKINDKMEYKVDRATEGYKFMWDMHHDPVRAMIVHHRIPTSSDNTLKQTHPILVDNCSLKYKYLLVHNGVIRNDKELKKEHEALGFVYTTQSESEFNDSESIAIELARFIEKQIDKVGAKGSAAFIGLQIDKKTDKVNKLFFGRNEGNPLKLAKTREKLFLSSTGPGDEVAPYKLYECKLDEEMKLYKRKLEFIVDTPLVIINRNVVANSLIQKGVTSNDWDKWESNYAKKHQYYHLRYNEDIPIAEENSEIETTIIKTAEYIQADIDSFLDLFYDPTTVENLDKKDIENMLDNIGEELSNLLLIVKGANLEISLEQECRAPAMMGFGI